MTHISSSSSKPSSGSESFYHPSNSDQDSYFCSDHCSDFDTFRSTFAIDPRTIKADPTIYSFAWSRSDSESLIMPNKSQASGVKYPSTSKPPLKATDIIDKRFLKPPPLPYPVFWSSLTHPDDFHNYINAKGLGKTSSSLTTIMPTGSATTQAVQECILETAPPSQHLSNIYQIELQNTASTKIFEEPSAEWLVSSLFADRKFTVPFNVELVTASKELWVDMALNAHGDRVLKNIPSTASEATTILWLNSMSDILGTIHFPSNSPDKKKPLLERAFHDGGRNNPAAGGVTSRKPDIVLIDRVIAEKLKSNQCANWSIVQALIEVTVRVQPGRSLQQTLLSKAANIFAAQLHRRYILGLGVFGKGNNINFFLMLINRSGAVSTPNLGLKGYHALLLLRILYAFRFGGDDVLGMDLNISIDRATGCPKDVVVDSQKFTFVKEIHTSPYLFSRGTHVFIVKDARGQHHIFKDSWILASHAISEIHNLQLYSRKVSEVGAQAFRLPYLTPRFIAGDNHADDTDATRGLVRKLEAARIRRRIVTGPIGDPITSYLSRVECIQSLLDVVDQLIFLYNNCGLVHGDISISNIVIVRFLPNVISPLYPPSKDGAPSSVVPSLPDPAVLHASDSDGGGSNDEKASKSFKKSGLPAALESGGTLIDFDYSRPKNATSGMTSGTLPYMSIELTRELANEADGENAKDYVPIQHRLDHDLESVLMVLLHIARFTLGPAAKPEETIKADQNMIRWHHSNFPKEVVDNKESDVNRIYTNPSKYLTSYWEPIGHLLSNLIKVVYPGVEKVDMKTGHNICQPFKQGLVEILKYCRESKPETPTNYATFVAKKRKAPQDDAEREKRSRSKKH